MICNKCGVDKPLSEFYEDKKRKSGVCTICKECMKKRVREYSLNNKAKILEYHKQHYPQYAKRQRALSKEYHDKVQSLKTPCVKCGESRIYVIDFHHVDPEEKAFNINRKSRKSDFGVIEEEVSVFAYAEIVTLNFIIFMACYQVIRQTLWKNILGDRSDANCRTANKAEAAVLGISGKVQTDRLPVRRQTG